MDLEILATLKSPEEIKKYVDQVIEEVINSTKHEDVIGWEHTTPHKGFIDKNTTISNVDSYCKIDSNRYAYLYAAGLSKNKITNLATASNLIYSFIVRYFGLDGDEEKRQQIYYKTNTQIPDISVLEGKNCAVCAERAALAQNLFSLLGYETYYIVGNVNNYPHAFNVINVNGRYLLYDASKDVPVKVDGKITGYNYYSAVLSDEQVEKLFNGEIIETIGKRTYQSFGKYNLGKTKQ